MIRIYIVKIFTNKVKVKAQVKVSQAITEVVDLIVMEISFRKAPSIKKIKIK